MKANELMIGDWVYVKDYPMNPEAKQVTANHFVRSLCEFKPIPLTEEILKANGFIHKDTMDEWWHEEYDPTWGIRMSDFELTDEFNFGRAKITYVHELQHALRLAGLQELADNFKIQ